MDVLLLCEIFEANRLVTYKIYKVEELYFYTRSSRAFEKFLLTMERDENGPLELICDAKIYELIEGGMRGGSVVAGQKFAECRNDFVVHDMEAGEEKSYITYLDFNSLYPSVISQYKLPHSKFHFLSEDELEGFTTEYILSLKADDDYGYFICADVEYPDTLHDEHGELPMLPSRMMAPCSLTRQEKLMPSFIFKEFYLSHYLMLQFVVRHGLIIKKIHHVIKFFQSRIAKPFVDGNMARRAEATSKFEKDCIKLIPMVYTANLMKIRQKGLRFI